MKKLVILSILISAAMFLSATRKALVVGNAEYGQNSLVNSVNDAVDFARTLQDVGFVVTLKTDVDQRAFEEAVETFYADIKPVDEVLFYYSGHGLQYNGENFLIPARANIDNERALRYDAVNANRIAEYLERAMTSIIILDACRESPFRKVRSSGRGLTSMEAAAGTQYIIYSTASGKTAEDGSDRNSPFTAALIKYIPQANLEITALIRNLSKEVAQKTGSRQIPCVYGSLMEEFYFVEPAYGENKHVPVEEKKSGKPGPSPAQTPELQVIATTGSILVYSNLEAEVYLDGARQGLLSAETQIRLSPVLTGNHDLELRRGPKTEIRNILVERDLESKVNFDFNFFPEALVRVEGGRLDNGTSSVTVNSFYIGKYELTQAEYKAVMGSNPASDYGFGDSYPVYKVSWFDAIEYCNRRSLQEGLKPCYKYASSGSNPAKWPSDWKSNYEKHANVSCNWIANGYRLPTEMEWMFAARGGNKTHNFIYSGSNDPDAVAWNLSNSGSTSHTIGGKLANELGLYDMSGNVLEWCWDIFDDYPSDSKHNPKGASSGFFRVLRGGGWNNEAYTCTVAYRNGYAATDIGGLIGFRCVKRTQ